MECNHSGETNCRSSDILPGSCVTPGTYSVCMFTAGRSCVTPGTYSVCMFTADRSCVTPGTYSVCMFTAGRSCVTPGTYSVCMFTAGRWSASWARSVLLNVKKTKLHGLSPRANYTDWVTAACRRSDCQFVRKEGATWSAWRIPLAVFLGFLDRSRYFSIK
jgi:hypothetical protein